MAGWHVLRRQVACPSGRIPALGLRLGAVRLCTDADPYAVLGVPRTAEQAEIRNQYLKLAKETHPDVTAGGDDAAFRRVSWAYEQLSEQPSAGAASADTPWQVRYTDNPGAQAYRRDQTSVDKAMMAMMAMQLAAAGKRADALELLLSASSGKMPGTGEKAALFVFDACTAHSFSQQPVDHAKVAALWRWLLEYGAVDAQACEAWMWKWKSIRALQPFDALEASRLAAERATDEGFARNVWRDMP